MLIEVAVITYLLTVNPIKNFVYQSKDQSGVITPQIRYGSLPDDGYPALLVDSSTPDFTHTFSKGLKTGHRLAYSLFQFRCMASSELAARELATLTMDAFADYPPNTLMGGSQGVMIRGSLAMSISPTMQETTGTNEIVYSAVLTVKLSHDRSVYP